MTYNEVELPDPYLVVPHSSCAALLTYVLLQPGEYMFTTWAPDMLKERGNRSHRNERFRHNAYAVEGLLTSKVPRIGG